MSVINKMLRDLDQRQATQPLTHGQTATPQPALRQGTSSVPYGPFGQQPAAGARAHRRWIGPSALLVVVAGAAGAALWWQAGGTPPAVQAQAPTPAPAVASPVAPAHAVAPVATTAAAAVTEPAPDAVKEAVAQSDAPGSMALRMESSLSARRALNALLSTPAPAPVTVPPLPASPTAERPKAQAVAGATSPAPPPAAAKTSNDKDIAPVLQRQQQAGGDALAQAQSLWNSGSRDAAIDLLQQSIAVAERAAKSAGGTSPNPVLLSLVREMARMQLAEARYGAVWEMLTRLEPLLGNQPDLWAIRANAAQRLGRHPDSVHAYMMALQSRPDEQRWMLGTAVSLAALGQTASAAEMAEKARAQGPVSKDILAYLRQAGVPLKD